MRIQIPVVDLVEGDVVHGVIRDGLLYTTAFDPPRGRVVEMIGGVPHIYDPMTKRKGPLTPAAYPPGALFDVERRRP